jgi:predicted site-specific integrase-resolvase
LKYYSIGEFAKLIGKTQQTLRNWDKNGYLKPAYIAPSGFRYYSEEQLHQILGIAKPVLPKKVIGYCRVSSPKQKGDLENQMEYVKQYMIAKGYQFEMITDIGNGMNFNKNGLNRLIDMVTNGEVEKIVILNKDRLARFGFELFEIICSKYATTIEIIDNTEETDERELVEDLIQVITVFSSKLQGKRANKAKQLIKELRQDD